MSCMVRCEWRSEGRHETIVRSYEVSETRQGKGFGFNRYVWQRLMTQVKNIKKAVEKALFMICFIINWLLSRHNSFCYIFIHILEWWSNCWFLWVYIHVTFFYRLLCVMYCDDCSQVTFWCGSWCVWAPPRGWEHNTGQISKHASASTAPMPALSKCLSPIAGPATAIKPDIVFQIYLKGCLDETSCMNLLYIHCVLLHSPKCLYQKQPSQCR